MVVADIYGYLRTRLFIRYLVMKKVHLGASFCLGRKIEKFYRKANYDVLASMPSSKILDFLNFHEELYVKTVIIFKIIKKYLKKKKSTHPGGYMM